MNLLLDVRQGAQRPQRQLLPAGKVSSSAGQDAVELAASAGLVLDDWQAWVLSEALAERADGLWAAYECGLIVPRQNGKGSILEALELYHLFVLGSRLIIHSAHQLPTAEEHFARLWGLIEDNPELKQKCLRPLMANGRVSVRLKSGARLRIAARSRAAIRGFSAELVVFDEAMTLTAEQIGAMGPALSAMPNPQIWYTASAPHSDSHVLHRVRNRGLAGDEERLFFAEWGNMPDVDLADPVALRNANPGWPHRLTPENLAAEKAMMFGLGDEYARERLGVPSPEDALSGIFPPGVWNACLDTHSAIAGSLRVALDVGKDLVSSTFAAGGVRADGLAHGEIMERQPGTGWVVVKALEFAAKYGPIVIDPKGPVGAIVADLKAAHVPLEELTEPQVIRACGNLQDKVLERKFRHLGQTPLDMAVNGAGIRITGDTWRWSRSSSTVDISPLVAVTFAALQTAGGPSRYWSASDL